MTRNIRNVADVEGIPASLQRKVMKEPIKMVTFKIPHPWWEELSTLAREYDQDVSTFLREATEDWLQRARKVHRRKAPGS
jgi:DNA-directed RNA polymerase subunit L